MENKMRIAALCALAAGMAFAAPNVKIDSVLQRYPWSNIVDIRYTVSGLAEGAKADLAISAKIDGGETFAVTNATVEANGSYVQQWTPGPGICTTNCTMFGELTPPRDYMIVNLTNGAIRYEAWTSQETANATYNTNLYKTTHMVFRRIPAAEGVILQTNAIGRSFRFSHDYYIGVFPVTEAQYKLLVKDGSGTSRGDTCPVGSISWEQIRGTRTNFNEVAGIDFATDSTTNFIAVLNKKVKAYYGGDAANAKFDLPTEAAWEYAAAAGTSCTNEYFFGPTGADLGTYAWYSANSGNVAHPVGTKEPNPWGLYDVYGNVFEWVRDRWDGNTFGTLDAQREMPSDGFMAASSGSDDARRDRGGSYYGDASYSQCTSLWRSWADYDSKYWNYGFRLAWGVQE